MSIDAKQRAQTLVLELVNRSRNNQFLGKTRLFKAFYLAHLYFARSADTYLTEWPIVHMPMGPGIGKFDVLIRDLVERGDLEVELVDEGPYVEYQFHSGVEPDISVLPNGAVDAISKSLDYIANKTAGQLSAEAHERSRAWRDAQSGEELNIYIDLLDDDHYMTRIARAQKNEEAITAVFG